MRICLRCLVLYTTMSWYEISINFLNIHFIFLHVKNSHFMVFILPKIERLYMAIEHLGNIKFVLISCSTFKKNVDLKFQLTYYKEVQTSFLEKFDGLPFSSILTGCWCL